MWDLGSLIEETLRVAKRVGSRNQDYRDRVLANEREKWQGEMGGRAAIASMQEGGASERALMQDLGSTQRIGMQQAGETERTGMHIGFQDRQLAAQKPGWDASATKTRQLNEYDAALAPDRLAAERKSLVNAGFKADVDRKIAESLLPKPPEPAFDPYYTPSSPGYNRVKFPKRKPSFLFSPLSEYFNQ